MPLTFTRVINYKTFIFLTLSVENPKRKSVILGNAERPTFGHVQIGRQISELIVYLSCFKVGRGLNNQRVETISFVISIAKQFFVILFIHHILQVINFNS